MHHICNWKSHSTDKIRYGIIAAKSKQAIFKEDCSLTSNGQPLNVTLNTIGSVLLWTAFVNHAGYKK